VTQAVQKFATVSENHALRYPAQWLSRAQL
jgi:hypothetical protein